jgi:hypothetical protein
MKFNLKKLIDNLSGSLHSCASRMAPVLRNHKMLLAQGSCRSNNPGNNRPLPQTLWDAIERFG